LLPALQAKALGFSGYRNVKNMSSRFSTIGNFLSFKKECPFCKKDLIIVLRYKDKIIKYNIKDDGIIEFDPNQIYNKNINYNLVLFDKILLKTKSNDFFVIVKENILNRNLERYDGQIKISLSCENCPKYFVVRSSEIYLEIDNIQFVDFVVDKNNKDADIAGGKSKMLLCSGGRYSDFSLTEEIAVITNDSCAHFSLAKGSKIGILSFGLKTRDSNGYFRFNVLKEVELDANKFSLEEPESLFKKIKALMLLK
jgi:hypothetical protein